MQCPPKITAILCEILSIGLLRIRATNDSERCALEADHLHNLPGLLHNFNTELLDYYWDVERVCFIQLSAPDEVKVYDPLWRSLAKLMTASE